MANPLPTPPFIEVDGVYNLRDPGDGKHFRQNLVFRSADPSKATPEGLQKMSQDLGIRTIFDLRSLPEIKRDGPEWAGVAVDDPDPFKAYTITRKWVPVFAADDYGPEQVALRYKQYTRSDTTEGFVQAYRDILLAGGAAYGHIFRHLATREKPTPCLVHCTAGKDRTGVLVALLFMLVGADEEAIGEEYSLTDLGLAPLKPLFIQRLLKNPALEGNEEGVLNMVSSKKENMIATVRMIREEFDGPEAYMKKYCGLSEEEVEQVRRNVRPA